MVDAFETQEINIDLELSEIDKNKKGIESQVMLIEIKSTPDMERAVSITQSIKEKIKNAKGIMAFFVNPLKKQVKDIQAKFDPYIESFEKAEGILKTKMITYQVEQDKIAKEEEARLRKEQEAKYLKEVKKAEKKDVPPPPPPPPITVTKPKISGFSMRKPELDYEIVNINLMEREFMIDDRPKILKAIKAGLKVSGIRVYEKAPVAAVSQAVDDL